MNNYSEIKEKSMFGNIDEKTWNELEKSRKIIKWNKKNSSSLFNDDYLQLLESIDRLDLPTIKIGEIINGKIIKISKKEMIVDINYKDYIFIDIKASDSKIIENLKIGENINVIITGINEKPYQICGSVTELLKLEVTEKLKIAFKDNTHLVAHVDEIIPAGFMMTIDIDNISIPAFMPNTLAGVNKLTTEQNEKLVGKTIEVMLETLQQEKGVYVVSRKKYLNTLIPLEIKKLNKETVYTGLVTGTKDFGVFVEFNGCLTGMIHKVNIRTEWQDKIDKIKSGTKMEFYIRDILKGNRLILTQIYRESLWDIIKVGQVMEGTIKSIKPFGILVKLDDETNGLIQNCNIDKNSKYNEGDKVKVLVVKVIKDDRKIYLNFVS
jgi:small subunit ribosomal protein S1